MCVSDEVEPKTQMSRLICVQIISNEVNKFHNLIFLISLPLKNKRNILAFIATAPYISSHFLYGVPHLNLFSKWLN